MRRVWHPAKQGDRDMLKQHLEQRDMRSAARREAEELVQQHGWSAWCVSQEGEEVLPEHVREFIELRTIAVEQQLGDRASWDWASR